ncbi:MAG TPA: hypothetical protein PL068_00420 [Petrotogaceae bacterium]|nr:hypothetical protein [Petrotogaceae bacterium]HQC40106.1 hypothetical protein [Petrotogaceae bacterium]
MRKYIMFIIIVITLLIPFSAAARDNKGIITDPAKELKWNYFVDNLLYARFLNLQEYSALRGLGLNDYVLIDKPGEINDKLIGSLSIGNRMFPILNSLTGITDFYDVYFMNASYIKDEPVLTFLVKSFFEDDLPPGYAWSLIARYVKALFHLSFVDVEIKVNETYTLEGKNNIGELVTRLYAKNSSLYPFGNWDRSYAPVRINNNPYYTIIEHLGSIQKSYNSNQKTLYLRNLFPIAGWSTNWNSNFSNPEDIIYLFPELELYADFSIPFNQSPGDYVLVLDMQISPSPYF